MWYTWSLSIFLSHVECFNKIKEQVNKVKPFILFVTKNKSKIKCSIYKVAFYSSFDLVLVNFSETFQFFIEADAKQFTD